MSFIGTHYSRESKEALYKLSGHCRLCRYKARLQFDFSIFSDHVCERCGLKFPASVIDKAKWFYKIRHGL
jgi:hypothetical protein